MDPSPKNNRGAPHPGPIKLEVLKRCRPTVIYILFPFVTNTIVVEITDIASCRKFVIGFAFMVPDVNYNEAYISFVLVHPEWRRGGIGTYMIYHLIQTCMGKDVTLHVSVTNPAMLMYQKFGFKPEEFILDFL